MKAYTQMTGIDKKAITLSFTIKLNDVFEVYIYNTPLKINTLVNNFKTRRV